MDENKRKDFKSRFMGRIITGNVLRDSNGLYSLSNF